MRGFDLGKLLFQFGHALGVGLRRGLFFARQGRGLGLPRGGHGRHSLSFLGLLRLILRSFGSVIGHIRHPCWLR